MSADHDRQLADDARRLFAGACDFTAGAATTEQIPPASLPEIAFTGRSNVGKSSLINALTGRKTLARISNTPGRTQQLNFFSLGGKLMLVDLPGYGYAKVSRGKATAWNHMAETFLKGRATLRRVCVLIDGRHGLKDSDRSILKTLDSAAVSYQVVLTKIDKVKPEELAAVCEELAAELVKHPAAHPEIIATSAMSGAGIEPLRIALASMAATTLIS